MKTALIITTINVPRVLSLYRAHDPDVRFFVAGDSKSPPVIPYNYVDNCAYLNETAQKNLGYKCSELIGWNTIDRRNIALLEALKWGAELIVSIDDDNIPLDPFYFEAFMRALHWRRKPYPVLGGQLFDGVMARPHYGRWFDPASLCFPKVVQRGFPQELDWDEVRFKHVTGAKIGIAQGMILGDPDTSAVDRISQHPEVHQVSELLRAGIVTDPRETWAPLNSQNIAFIRELAPCFLMVPAFGRYDDIYAGLVAQRVAREFGYHVHFGQPFVLQQRNPHDLLRDLAAEQWGAEHILDFTAWLDGFLGQTSVTGFMRVLFTNLPSWMPERGKLQELGLAWCSDCDEVMK
jgi:hypothetical protein